MSTYSYRRSRRDPLILLSMVIALSSWSSFERQRISEYAIVSLPSMIHPCVSLSELGGFERHSCVSWTRLKRTAVCARTDNFEWARNFFFLTVVVIVIKIYQRKFNRTCENLLIVKKYICDCFFFLDLKKMGKGGLQICERSCNISFIYFGSTFIAFYCRT